MIQQTSDTLGSTFTSLRDSIYVVFILAYTLAIRLILLMIDNIRTCTDDHTILPVRFGAWLGRFIRPSILFQWALHL